MIKINLTPEPAQLDDTLKNELLKEYLADNSKDVWNKKFIREAALNMTNDKCIYSEVRLNESSIYMELDHFLPKKHHPNEVITWGNLLPCSKKCNTTKGENDTSVDIMVNPLYDIPRDYLYIKGWRFYPKNNSDIGRNTIDFTAINDRHFVKPRTEVCQQIMETLENLYNELSETILKGCSTNLKTRFKTKVKALLKQGSRDNEYSAAIATTILSDVYVYDILDYFTNIGEWDNEFENLFKELEEIQLIG